MENVTVEQLTKPVKADPALAGRVLKLVNSSANHLSKPVIDLDKAIMRLGTNVLGRLALTLSIIDSNQNGACKAFDYQQFWSTCLLRALAIKGIARLSPILPPEEAFTVGLIAQIGQLALAQIYPNEYGECLNAKNYNNPNSSSFLEVASKDLIQTEQLLFAIDQNQITLAMLNDWGMPIMVMESVSLFLNGNNQLGDVDTTEQKLAAQLLLASAIAGQVGFASGIYNIQEISKQLNISDDQLHDLLQELFNAWPEWKKLLSIENPLSANKEVGNYNPNSLGQGIQQLGMRILLVEDDRIQLHLLSTCLSQKGYQVRTATTAEEALKEVLVSYPQIVISDYRMSPMDGLSLCRALKMNTEARWVYFILITADQDSTTLSNAFQAGVNDFICKPIKQIELDARLLGAQRMLEVLNSRVQEREDIRNYAFQLASSTRRLEIMTVTDQLTSLPNRRYAVKRLDQEWANFILTGAPFAILSLDLDFFKQVNDNYGHDTGDQVLIHFAQILEKSIRTNDVACRMGGEEFIVISAHSDCNSLKTLGERIRLMVETQQPQTLNLTRLITVSIGGALSDLSLDEKGWGDTLKRSDQALYEAKTAGRNLFKLINDNNQRRHERFNQQAEIKVKIITPKREQEFVTAMENISKSGLFLRTKAEVQMVENDLVELQGAEFNDAKWQIAKVVRVTPQGFAIEFLSSSH